MKQVNLTETLDKFFFFSRKIRPTGDSVKIDFLKGLIESFSEVQRVEDTTEIEPQDEKLFFEGFRKKRTHSNMSQLLCASFVSNFSLFSTRLRV